MSAVTVPCPHCAHPSRIRTERLPDKPVFFACPSCSKKVAVDKRKLAPDSQEAPPALDHPPLTVESTPPADRRFLTLPPHATLPSGIILGEDDDAIAAIQESLQLLGSQLERLDSAAAAREMISAEQPELCIYVAGSLEAQPHAPMAPLTGLSPNFRRRLFLVLIADNLKTLDGNTAFICQVNMTLARQDLPHLGAAIFGGIDYHNRLYAPYHLAEETRGAL